MSGAPAAGWASAAGRRLVLALLLGAAAADLLGAAADAPTLWSVGARLAIAGVGAGVLELMVRLLRAPRRWGRAAALLGALSLFAVAAWVRGDPAIPPDPAVLLAEAIAAILLLLVARADRRETRR